MHGPLMAISAAVSSTQAELMMSGSYGMLLERLLSEKRGQIRKQDTDLSSESASSKTVRPQAVGRLAVKMLRVLINCSKIQYDEHPLL